MTPIVTKRFLVAGTLILGFIGACGTDDPPGNPDNGPAKTLVCESDAECEGEKPYCDPYSGCAECLLNAQCEEGAHCVERECVVPTECTASEECDVDNPVCNPIVGECVGCVGDDDCTDGTLCLDGRCTGVTVCVNSLDCNDGEVCDRALGYCVQCVADGDCGVESACVENACVLRCDSDNDCRSGGLLCDPAAGHCVECVEQADCPDVYNCRSGRCVVDECLQGTSVCTDGYNAFSRCNDTGSASEIESCPFESTCWDSESGTAICLPWACSPGSVDCSQDGQTLEVCNETGLDFTTMDCGAEGGTCLYDACVDVVCDPLALFCDANVLYQCDNSGTTFGPVQTCASSEFCNEEAGACSPQACSPGATACSGTVQQVCNADGSAFETAVDCNDDDAACVGGECVPKVCTPGEKSCSDDGTLVYVCDTFGTALLISSTCSTSQYCDEATTQCRVRSCTPGAPVCDGEVATTCNDEGSGVEPDGTDCAEEDNQACYEGECLPRICTGRYCKEGNSYNCVENGTADSIRTTCSSTDFCNEATGDCEDDECTPDSAGCVDNTPGICKADGSAYELSTPCESDERCVSGTCLPVICVANTYYCEGQAIYDCGYDGTTTSLVTTCSASYFCEEGRGTCQLDDCDAGEPVCNGAALSVCKSDGSGPEDAGDACPSGETCEDGACAEIICTPNEIFCDADTLNLCNALGTAIEDSVACSTAQFCDESRDPTSCVSDICAAGQPACDGETPSTCKDNGGGYKSPKTDCSASDKVCNGTACVNAADDTVGGTTSSGTYSSYRYANQYYITTDRTLTEIQQYFSVTGTSQFTWFVYEGTTSSSFTKVFESLNTSSGADTFHSSGTISVPLVKGRYYMIGVRVSGSATRFYTTNVGGFVSFGKITGSDYESTSGSLPSSWSVSSYSYDYHQTLTTKLP